MSTEPKVLAPGTRIITKVVCPNLGGIEGEIVGLAEGYQGEIYEVKYLECKALERSNMPKPGQTSAWHRDNFTVVEVPKPAPKFKLGDRVTQRTSSSDWAAVVSKIRCNEKDKTWEYKIIYGDGSGSFCNESKLYPTDRHPKIERGFTYPKELYEPPPVPKKKLTEGTAQLTPVSLTAQEQTNPPIKETPPMAAPSGVTPVQKLSNLVMEILQSERKELVASKDFKQAVTDTVATVYKFDQEKFNTLIKERVEKEVKERVGTILDTADGAEFRQKLDDLAEEKLEEWIENHLTDKVDEEVEKRAERAVDDYVDNYDFSDKAEDAVKDAAGEYDFSSEAEEAIKEAARYYDFEEKVEGIVNTLVDTFDFAPFLKDAFAHTSWVTIKEWINLAVRNIIEDMSLGSYLADKEMVELHAAQIASLVDQVNYLRVDYTRRERDLNEQIDKANQKMRSVEISCLPWWKRLWNRIR